MGSLSHYYMDLWILWDIKNWHGFANEGFKLTCFNLCDKIITYTKDKGNNLNTFTNALTNVVSCVPQMLWQPCVGSCYGHVMSKCCQYATNNLKFSGAHEGGVNKSWIKLYKTIENPSPQFGLWPKT